jgi:Glycogen recognition site of AMP-activated protein kinase
MTMKQTFDAEPDALVQRFVDQELTAEERIAFVARLGRDEALRRRTIDLEQLVLHATRLPRPVVPDTFAANVMERIATPSPWRTLLDTLWTPHAFRWNLAGAMAAASLAAIVVATLLTRSGSKPAIAPSPPSATLVRLMIVEPGAKTVQVAGDFNGWNPMHTSLEQISDGAWAVTIPLKPGRYAYMFVVDGQRWVADPFAAEQKDDGFGSRNAVLDVRPPDARAGSAL